MVFHNSISFASNHDKEPQKLIHNKNHHPSSMGQTTMTMMPSIHQRQRLQSQFIILLTRLDDKIEHSLWETLGEADNGLWNLFGFKKFDDFVNFMVDCGFIGRKHRVTKKPFFVEMVFAQACNSRFQQIRVGKKKLRYLEVGRRRQGKDAKQKRPVQQPDLKSWPLIHFWESLVMKKWLHSYSHPYRTPTPGKQQLLSKRKDRPTPIPIKKKHSPLHLLKYRAEVQPL
jgi:hypothetical protein